MMIAFSNARIAEERAFVRFQEKRMIDRDYVICKNLTAESDQTKALGGNFI